MVPRAPRARRTSLAVEGLDGKISATNEKRPFGFVDLSLFSALHVWN